MRRTPAACRIVHIAGHNPAGHRRPSPGCRCRAMSRGVGRIVDRSAPFAANFAGGLVAAYRRSTSRTLLAFVGAPQPATDKDHSLFGSAHLVHVDTGLTVFVLSPSQLFPPPSKRHKRPSRGHDICVWLCVAAFWACFRTRPNIRRAWPARVRVPCVRLPTLILECAGRSMVASRADFFRRSSRSDAGA